MLFWLWLWVFPLQALLPVLSLEHNQRAPILGALEKALRRAKPHSATHAALRKVRKRVS